VYPSLGFPCTAADLWKEEIDAKGSVLVDQIPFQLGDLFSEHVWSIADLGELGKVGDLSCSDLRLR
jgi:hypothetical protein